MIYPTLRVDNFFKKFDQVKEWANSLEYLPNQGTYPGHRTKSLHEIDPLFFQNTTRKIAAILFPNDYIDMSWGAFLHFQKTDPKVYPGSGFIHQDSSAFEFAVILYLDGDIESGTSIFRPKGISVDREGYVDFKSECYKNPEMMQTEEFRQAVNKHNNQFEELAYYKAIPNSMLLFDTGLDHGVKDFGTKERLTMVAFFSFAEREKHKNRAMKYPLVELGRCST
jgi:hypothetical protein|tara:strand:- start:369 stop:1040 length:672 start_codon:yes stop_codon:yes gene_type:complete